MTTYMRGRGDKSHDYMHMRGREMKSVIKLSALGHVTDGGKVCVKMKFLYQCVCGGERRDYEIN